MDKFVMPVVLGVFLGTYARLHLLRVDFRQYPSYPQGYTVHLFLGFVAASMGAVAIPALVAKHYEAVTFLALALQQFREVRRVERETLEKLEETELVPRGTAYVEGIAKVFEARNYLAVLTALVASGLAFFLPFGALARGAIAAAGGLVTIFLLEKSMEGGVVGSLARINPAPLEFRGPQLFVEDTFVMNVGLRESREIILKHGLGAIIEPVDPNARATLSNIGQRQAIVHDLATILGVRKDLDEPEFTPIARLNHENGHIGVVIVPMARDEEALKMAIQRVPVIESAKRRPLEAIAGKEAYKRAR